MHVNLRIPFGIACLALLFGCAPTPADGDAGTPANGDAEVQEPLAEEPPVPDQGPPTEVAEGLTDTEIPEQPSTSDTFAPMREFIASKDIDLEAGTSRLSLPMPPQLTFPEGESYFWTLETNLGSIRIRLMPDVAPFHVSSTIFLTLVGFYDGIVFHRIIPGFMVQGGCPLGTGMGSPGYGYDGEFDDNVRHGRPGLLSMANTGRPKSDGSQFFLTLVPTPHLDGKHTIFGEVVEGMETLREMEKRGTRSGATTERVTLKKATITIE